MTAPDTHAIPEIEALVEAVRSEAERYYRLHGDAGLESLGMLAVAAMRNHTDRLTRWQNGDWRYGEWR